jgi:rhamnogalacturonan endolyase
MIRWNSTTTSLWAIAWVVGLLLSNAGIARAQTQGVTISEDAATYTLDNGIVKAMVAKASGDLVSLKYKNLEMLATFLKPDGTPDLEKDPPGEQLNGLNRQMTDHQYGFWSHDAMGPAGTGAAIAKITIDPRTNGGERGEVSVKGISNGRKMGTGPGARPANPGNAPHVPGEPGNFIADIEIRWALGRGDSGVYTYCQFQHTQDYAASTITEARFCVKLADYFDWMSVTDDEHHNKLYPASLREGDKYIYTSNQFNNPAFGWSSTTKNVGFFIINPSNEYMSGGPTKIEFLGHRDTNTIAAPCVLNYWRSSHYGGADVTVANGEQWTKVIGPFMLYVNSGADSQSIYTDAKAQAAVQQKAWPFNWVKGVDYPVASERATVKGQLVLTDPQAKSSMLPNLLVGLTAPAYQLPGFGGGPGRTIDWQQDAKHYEFWVRGNEDGSFQIPNVRPGTYTMHAFADGVLGEFAKANVTVESGKPLDMGKITWTPVRKGKQLWEIGMPNRGGREFFKGDVYWTPKIGMSFATLFPADPIFTIGKSDYAKDWFFLHVPRFDEPMSAAAAAAAAARGPARGGRGPATASALARGGGPATAPGARFGGRGNLSYGDLFGPAAMGKATTYTIAFDMPAAVHGKATLRTAYVGRGTRTIAVAVNDKPAGQISLPIGDGVISDHGQHGIWIENEFAFDASLLRHGQNTLKLTVPEGNVNSGVIYDYLRLELDESALPSAMAQ